MHALGFLTPEEMLALSVNLHRVCKATIERVWEDESLTIEQATALSDWVWRHLMTVGLLGVPSTSHGTVIQIGCETCSLSV